MGSHIVIVSLSVTSWVKTTIEFSERPTTCCPTLRRSKYTTSMGRRDSRGAWAPLLAVGVVVCLTSTSGTGRATFSQFFGGSNPFASFFSASPGGMGGPSGFGGVHGTEGMDIDIEELIGGLGNKNMGGQFGRPSNFGSYG